MMFLKMLIWHLVIGVLSILMLSIFFSLSNVNDQTVVVVCIFSFFIVLFLYGYSGYYSTIKTVKWYNYFTVAFVGVFGWIICFVKANYSTNYKQDSEAGVWFFYEIYISSKSALNFVDLDNYSLKKDLIAKLFYPILFSICQFSGGLIKTKKLETPVNSG
jgi:hypothetical protein